MTISTAPLQEGAGYYQNTMRDGVRSSTAAAYLKPARKRGNLHVVVGGARNAHPVRRPPRHRRRVPGGRRDADSARQRRGPGRRRRVQLAATPATVRAWARGAAALARHRGRRRPARRRRPSSAITISRASSCAATSRSRSTTRCATGAHGATAVMQYALFRRGYFATPAISAGCFLRARCRQSATPDVQMLDRGVFGAQPRRLARSVLWLHHRLHAASARKPRPCPHQVGRSAASARRSIRTISPRARTATRSRRRQGAAPPRAAPALARSSIAEEIDPGPQCVDDDDLLDFIRRRGSTVYHPVSTCRMGPDPKAVVDDGSRCAASNGCA